MMTASLGTEDLLPNSHAYGCATPAYEEPKIDIGLITSSRKFDIGIVSHTLRSSSITSFPTNKLSSSTQPPHPKDKIQPSSSSSVTKTQNVSRNNKEDKASLSLSNSRNKGISKQTSSSSSSRISNSLPMPTSTERKATPSLGPVAVSSSSVVPYFSSSSSPSEYNTENDYCSDSGLSRLSSIASAAVTETSDNEMKAYRLTMRMPRSIEEETTERLKLMRETYNNGGNSNNRSNTFTKIINPIPSTALLPKGNNYYYNSIMMNRSRKLSYLTDDDETDSTNHTVDDDNDEDNDDKTEVQETIQETVGVSSSSNDDIINKPSNPLSNVPIPEIVNHSFDSSTVSSSRTNKVPSSSTILDTVPTNPNPSLYSVNNNDDDNGISQDSMDWNYFADRYSNPVSLTTYLPSPYIQQYLQNYENVKTLLSAVQAQTRDLALHQQKDEIQQLLHQSLLDHSTQHVTVVPSTVSVPLIERPVSVSSSSSVSVASSIVSSIAKHQEEDDNDHHHDDYNPNEPMKGKISSVSSVTRTVETLSSASTKVPFRVQPVKRGTRPGDYGDMVPPPPLPPVRTSSRNSSVHRRSKDSRSSSSHSVSSIREHTDSYSRYSSNNATTVAVSSLPHHPVTSTANPLPITDQSSLSYASSTNMHYTVETVSPAKPVLSRNQVSYPVTDKENNNGTRIMQKKNNPSNDFVNSQIFTNTPEFNNGNIEPSSLNTSRNSFASSTEWVTLQPSMENNNLRSSLSSLTTAVVPNHPIASSNQRSNPNPPIDYTYASPVKYKAPNLQLPLDLSQDMGEYIPIKNILEDTLTHNEDNSRNKVSYQSPTKEMQSKVASYVSSLPSTTGASQLSSLSTDTKDENDSRKFINDITVNNVTASLELPISPTKANEILRETKEKVLRLLNSGTIATATTNTVDSSTVSESKMVLPFMYPSYSTNIPPVSSYGNPSILSVSQYLDSSFVSLPEPSLSSSINPPSIPPYVSKPYYPTNTVTIPSISAKVPSSAILHSNILQCIHLLPSKDDFSRVQQHLQKDATYADLWKDKDDERNLHTTKDRGKNTVSGGSVDPYNVSTVSEIQNTSQEIAQLVNQALISQAKVRATMESLGITRAPVAYPSSSSLDTSFTSVRTHDRDRDAKFLRSTSDTPVLSPRRNTQQVVSPSHSKIERLPQSLPSQQPNRKLNESLSTVDKGLLSNPPLPSRSKTVTTGKTIPPPPQPVHSSPVSSSSATSKKNPTVGTNETVPPRQPWHGLRYGTWQPARWEPTFESQGPLRRNQDTNPKSSISVTASVLSTLPRSRRSSIEDDISSFGSATQLLLNQNDYVPIGQSYRR